MAGLLSNLSPRRSNSFQKLVNVFFKQPGLPFADVLTAETIESTFEKHASLFGTTTIYSTATVLWAFLGQVLQDGKAAACQSAVAAIIAHRQLLSLSTPTQDTGDYCRARAKLSEQALRELACKVADNAETESDSQWLIKERHAKLVDGFTFTMPDTLKNQRQYPQAKTQQPGIGLPIARCVAVISLAIACVLDLAIGPYAGKETGETALLRKLMNQFAVGDIAVFDRYYCTFMMIAAMLGKGTDVCCRKHHLRPSDFRRGKQLGKFDHLIVWTRPVQKPQWMDQATYQSIPQQITLREIKLTISTPGFRVKNFIVITTLTDHQEFTKQDVANIYGYRWNVELDIRSIKSNLNLEHVRCKSPEMVRRELWTTILAYNLIRSVAAAAAMLHGVKPRQVSFTSTVQFVLQEWKHLSRCDLSEVASFFIQRMLKAIAGCLVANRPGRIEPRVVKRRPKPYKRMMKPRKILRQQLIKS